MGLELLCFHAAFVARQNGHVQLKLLTSFYRAKSLWLNLETRWKSTVPVALLSSFAKWTPGSSDLTVAFRASSHKRACRMAPAGAAGRHSSRPQSLCSLPTSQSMLKQQKAVASVTPGVYQIRTGFCRLQQCHMSVGKREARNHVGQSVSWRLTCYTKTQTEKSCR